MGNHSAPRGPLDSTRAQFMLKFVKYSAQFARKASPGGAAFAGTCRSSMMFTMYYETNWGQIYQPYILFLTTCLCVVLGVCRYCEREFSGRGAVTSRRRHEHNVHLQIRNFKCDVCGSAFKRNYHLKEHLFKQHKIGSLRSTRS